MLTIDMFQGMDDDIKEKIIETAQDHLKQSLLMASCLEREIADLNVRLSNKIHALDMEQQQVVFWTKFLCALEGKDIEEELAKLNLEM